MPGQISIGKDTFTIATGNELPRGRRGIVRRTRPTQPGDPTQVQTYRWALAGPLGLSRERDDGFLGVDYASLEHRYKQLLTSLPKRNTLALTAPAALFDYGLPTSTVSTVNWAEGAGDGDGDAHDELGHGIDGGTLDDATYWSTSTVLAELILGLGSLTDPGIDSGHRFRIRARRASGGLTIKLYQGTTLKALAVANLTNAGFATYEGVFAESSIANITDYTTLRLGISNNIGLLVDVAEVELEIPDDETVDRILAIQEDRGQLFAARGRSITQIEPVDMSEVENEDRTNPIVGMAFAGGEGLISFGTAKAVERRSAVDGAGSTYTAVAGNPKAHAMRYGSDRLWFVDADVDDQALKFSFDGLVTFSNVVKAGDQGVASTGIGVFGPYGMIGRRNGYFGFTNNGLTVRTIEGMDAFASELNGAASDSGFGWHYVAHKLGLASLIPGAVDNNAGPFAIPDFEGPIDGVVTAVFRWKGFLWITMLTDINDSASGTLWLLRGVFNPQITPLTGQLDWYTVDKHAAVNSYALAATAGRVTAEATLVRGSGASTLAFYDLAFRDREIARSGYAFSTNGGEWFGSMLVRGPNRRKTIRQYHVRVKNVDENNTWQLAVELDESDSFSDVGVVINSGDDGIRSVKSATGSPLTPQGLSGFAIKPRLTQVAGGDTLSDIALNQLDNLVGHWPMGEASGNALDASTNSNDGTVTLGAGARAETALNAGGDGSIEFDGVDTKIVVGDDAAIQNIFDGGGSVFFIFDADSDGEANLGKIAGKSLWEMSIVTESGGSVALRFNQSWSSGALISTTAVNLPLGITIIGVLTYNADDPSNTPIVYLFDGASLSTRTAGDGLTQGSTPTGTRSTDAANDLVIGNRANQTNSFDGHIDEVMLFSDILTANEAETLINRARALYAPPSLEGFLDIEVDERPDNVEAVEVQVVLQGDDYDLLRRYAIEESGEESLYRNPVKISFDDLDTYGFVLGINDVEDIDAGDGAQRATVSIILWDTS